MKVVKSPTTAFEEMKNLFLEESHYLMVLNARDIMNTSVVQIVRKTEMQWEKV